MNKMMPLIARTALKEEVKKEAKVSATRDKLAKSIAFSAYNLRWHTFSSIILKNIAFNSWFVKRSNFNTIWLSWLNRIPIFARPFGRYSGTYGVAAERLH